MQIAVSEFKARCTEILRTLKEPVQITNRGRIVAVVSPPPSDNPHNPLVGCLAGTVTYAPDWNEPLGADDWEACR